MFTNHEKIFSDSVFRLVSEVGYIETTRLLGINPFSKKSWTEDEVREYIVDLRSVNDPLFFDRNLLKIQTKAGQLISLEDNPVQKKIQAEIERQVSLNRPVRIKIPKARKHGVSTKVQSVFFGDSVFEANIQFLTVCHDMESARNIRQMFERFYRYYSNRKPLLKKISEKMWRFPNKDVGYLIDTADELETGRSFTFHRLHLSEVAFYREPETLMTGLLRSVDYNPNTMIIAESTARGWGGWWYEFVTDKNDYTLMFFAWFEDAGNSRLFIDEKEKIEFERSLDSEEKALMETYSLKLEQLNWRRFEIKNGFLGDDEMFRQEYPSTLEESFLASGRYFFAVTEVRKNLAQSEKAPMKTGFLEWDGEDVRFVEDRSGWWNLFHEPVEGWEFRYVTGTDPAEGRAVDEKENKDPDYSVITVWDRYKQEDVARLCARVDEDVVAEEIHKAAVYYGSACDCVERSSSGIAIINILKNNPSIYLYVRELQAKTKDGETVEYGFQTNKSSRDTLLTDLKTRIRLKCYKSNDKNFWAECLTFVLDEKGIPRGQRGTHDDRVLSAALALQANLQAAETSPIAPPEERVIPAPDADVLRPREDAVLDYVEF